MGKEQLKEVAKVLFLQNYKQKDIAAKLSVSENTITRWARDGQWASLRKNLLNSKHMRLAELYDELEETNRMIREKEGYKVATSREADARRKLIADISELETKYNIGQVTTVARDYVNFLSQIDHDFADKSLTYLEAFVEQIIEKQKWQD